MCTTREKYLKFANGSPRNWDILQLFVSRVGEAEGRKLLEEFAPLDKFIVLDGKVTWGNTHEEIATRVLGKEGSLKLFQYVDLGVESDIIVENFVAGVVREGIAYCQAWTLQGTKEEVERILRKEGYEIVWSRNTIG